MKFKLHLLIFILGTFGAMITSFVPDIFKFTAAYTTGAICMRLLTISDE